MGLWSVTPPASSHPGVVQTSLPFDSNDVPWGEEYSLTLQARQLGSGDMQGTLGFYLLVFNLKKACLGGMEHLEQLVGSGSVTAKTSPSPTASCPYKLFGCLSVCHLIDNDPVFDL